MNYNVILYTLPIFDGSEIWIFYLTAKCNARAFELEHCKESLNVRWGK